MRRAGLGWWVCIGVLLVTGCSERSNLEILDSAKAYLERKDTAAASVELRTLLQRKPNAGEARFLLGKILYEAGDTAGAEDQLSLALQYGYPDDEVVPLLARVLAGRNRSKAIVSQFADLEFRDPTATADLKVQVATARIQEREYEQAERDVHRAIALAPDHPEALVLRARLLAIRGDPLAADREVRALLVRFPLNPEALALRGDLFMMAGPHFVDASLAAHRMALERRPGLTQSHAAVLSMLIARGDLQGASGQWGAMKKALPDHPQTTFFSGVLALLKGDPERASTIAQRMLLSSPTDVRVLLLAGQAEMQLNRPEQAEALLSKAVDYATQAAAPRRLLADIYIRSGRIRDALEVLSPLLNERSDDAVALTLAGKAHLIAGNNTAAKAAFARARALDPDNKGVRTSEALARLAAGQEDTAFAELEAISKEDKGTAADMTLISARLERREFDLAREAAAEMARKLPGQALSDQMRGRIEVAAGDLVAARRHFEAALAKEPGYFPALGSLVELDLAEGRVEAASERLDAARRRDPASMQVRLAQAELAMRRGAPAAQVKGLLEDAVRLRPTDEAPHVALIDHFLVTGRGDLALQAAEKSVSLVPDSQVLLDRLGQVYTSRGTVELAIATYSKMMVQWPRSSLGYLRLAELYLEAGNVGTAVERVQAALRLAPQSVQAQRVAVLVALRQGKPEEAQAIARTVQKQRPDEAVGHELEGEIAMALKQFDGAAKAYRKALELGAPPPVARKLHFALTGAKRKAEAQQWADEWMKRHPGDTPFVVHLADVALTLGDLAKAEKHYRDAMQRLPGNALAMNNVAYVMVKQNKPGALALAEQAAKLAQDNATVLDTLAAAYAADNQLAKAIEWQRKAVELQPQTGMLRLTLARFYIQASDREKAVVELDRLATMGRSFSGYSEVAQLRKKLGP